MLPIADRIGHELIRSLITGYSDMAERFRVAFRSIWRVLIGIGAAWLVLIQWDVGAPDVMSDMMEDGPRAAWIGIAVNIGVALLIGWITTFAKSYNIAMSDVLNAIGFATPENMSENPLRDLWTVTSPQIADILPYILMVLILIFRPAGLFGKRES